MRVNRAKKKKTKQINAQRFLDNKKYIYILV